MRQRHPLFDHLIALVLLASILIVLPSSGATAADCDEVHVQRAGDTIVVTPNGYDDTANLQCALDLAASMSSAAVVLSEGDFVTDFLEVEGFHGVFRGSGSDLTTLSTLPEGLDCVARFEERRFVSLVFFGGGDVEVSDLTIGVGGRSSCAVPWLSSIDEDGTGFIAWDLDVAIQFGPGVAPRGTCAPAGQQNVNIHDITIDGIFPNYFRPVLVGRAFFGGLFVGGDVLRGCPESRSSGDFVISDVVLARIPQPLAVAWVDDSTVQVGPGNHIKTAAEAIIIQDMSDSDVVVAHNTVEDSRFWGVLAAALQLNFGEQPFSVAVHDNAVAARLWANGIGVIDTASLLTGRSMIDAGIVGNSVVLDDADGDGIRAFGSEGGLIADNVVSGAGRGGVSIFADRWQVLENDVTGFAPGVADIWLGVDARRNRVQCLTPEDTVLDEGSNNRVFECSLLELAGLPPMTLSVGADSVAPVGVLALTAVPQAGRG